MAPETVNRPSRRTLWVAGGVLLVAAAVVVVVGVAARRSQAAKLNERAAAQVTRTVVVISPASAGETAAIELPARIEAWARAPLYARVSGYLKSWKADIGTAVKAGQLLAEIETPELDQQLLQAQAELATARANAELSANTAKRWQDLLASGMVARQAVDEKLGDLTAKQSAVRAASANVERNLALKRFTRIVAPFDGVVTARNTDVGALINVGGAPGTELFVVSDTRKLRVYVNVPQNLVAQLKPGARAELTVPERADKQYAATVASMSNAITASSGSMLVQLTVENPAGELLPGSFANVSFALPRAAGTLSIPPSALIFNKAGLRVATVGADNKVVLKPVTVLRDLGTTIEIASGLQATDRVIESPPDGVETGDVVSVAVSSNVKKQ
ncbi:efflux RND transporter periplasmic adaptor subunit [Ramlibacter albus]|uniref:Efflux RND transporter periplasmic adaptor subunit n=1 Tax=Ramlibacter albus TaxID=2079448 RepID=A0A923MDJ6_9BURK|nr:efflux RND transporter periplasmic adaptor subunit [Ramlibacter albus]MBC5768181.1 efflux RND transporter periplasmic adaptor subunit [Ramlibacter albus]